MSLLVHSFSHLNRINHKLTKIPSFSRYTFIDVKMPGRGLPTVLLKVFWDLVICSPAVMAGLFLTFGVLERSSIKEIIIEIKEKAWRLYLAEWTVWPPAQISI